MSCSEEDPQVIWQVFCSLAIAYGVALAQPAPETVPTGTRPHLLTNQRVVLLAKAGYSEGSIIQIIHLKQSQFDVSPEGLAWLGRQGLTEPIIGAMVAAQRKQENIPPLPFHIISATPQSTLAENYVPHNRAGARVTPPPPASPLLPVSPNGPLPGRKWETLPWFVLPKLPIPASQVR